MVLQNTHVNREDLQECTHWGISKRGAQGYFTGGSRNFVATELASGSALAGYTQLWLMPGSQEIKGGRVQNFAAPLPPFQQVHPRTAGTIHAKSMEKC